MTIDVRDETAFATPYSPTHQISTDRRDGSIRIAVQPPVHGDVDVVLPFRHGLVGGAVLTHADPGEDGFALLFLSPPPSGDAAATGRDLTLVVDISGSMSGEKIDQAKSALRQALDALRPRDRFRLIAFSTAVRQFREGFTVATASDVAEARRFVDELQANGGTNLEGAIHAALSEPGDPERPATVMLMTDGIPSVGEQAPERLAANAAAQIGRARIFTVGLGHDVNTYLLDRLAVDGHGSATYVAPGADVGDAVGSLLSKLSRPALVDLRIVDAPVKFLEQAPAMLPDLFYGEELVVLARYRGEGTGPIVIEGRRNGKLERFTINATFTRRESGNDFIAPLWAARRIGELTREVRLEGATPALIGAIKDLGLRYGILTEYTAYLVQEPGVAATAPLPAPGRLNARDMTGADAFDAAKASASCPGSASLQSANAAVNGRLDEMRGGGGRGGANGRGSARPTSPEIRRAGGRLFIFRDSTWTDLSRRDSSKAETAIAPFSNAYFALLKARPALATALTVGVPVILAGRATSLRIAEGGKSEWAQGEPGSLPSGVRRPMTGNAGDLFVQYHASLVRMLYRRTGDRDRAEDIAQETFARAVVAPPRNPRPWLFAVALNLVREEGRTWARQHRKLELYRAEQPADTGPADEALERDERIGEVRAALDLLADRDREALLLKAEGFSYDEIAVTLGLARGAVGTTLARARQRLMQAYRAREGERNAAS